MVTTGKDTVLVVLQLTGGNDYLNSVVPYNNPLYWDYRPTVRVPENEVLKLDREVGLHPSMKPMKEFYDQENMAIIHGVGYEDSPRSHFRSMDIWHTCAPTKIGTEGWLGRAIKDLDPHKENVVTGVVFGQTIFRAMEAPGVPVACVSTSLDKYGLFPGMEGQSRMEMQDRFNRIYSPTIGKGWVMDYLGQTGLDAAKGADILKVAPGKYSSTVEYPDTSIASKLKGIAQVHLAGLGTRIFYCDQGSFDTHANQVSFHAKLWKEISEGMDAFFADLKEHDASENVVVFMFSEFGRRSHDNGPGTDHGAAGPCFVIGDRVKGGQYCEYPSIKEKDLVQGDPRPVQDFRGVFSTILEDGFGLDAAPIVEGRFERPAFLG